VTPRQAHLVYEFGEFRLDALRRVLSSRVDGQPLQVTGKIFDTLLYFVERPGQLLDKRTLMEALWPNVVVEESNLTQAIHTLRRVLGERPDDRRFIVTVPGRGYRCVADVTTTTVEEPLQPARRKLLAAAAAAVVILAGAAFWLLQGSGQPQRSPPTNPQALSIAVLPFVDMSEAQDQAYFAEGLSEEILNLLAQSTTLRVTARTSSFSFKGRNVDIPTIADTLNATHVLEGSVRRSGDRVRITAQLVDGTSSVHLWSQTYDRDMTDAFGVQDEIAAAVAGSLQVTLTGSASPAMGQTKNAIAFERYLQGKYFFNRRGESDVTRAQDYFEQALQLDPGYARAWAGLAGVYQLARQQGLPDAQPAWRAAVDQALRLGPNLADSHVRAAQFYWWLGDRDASAAHCERAIALNPSDPLVLATAAGRAFSAGHLSEGVALQRRAVAVDPLSAIGRANLGAYLMSIGEWEEAVAELERARELSPTLSRIDCDIARVQILRQRFDEALAATQRIPAGPARDQCVALTCRAPGQQTAADAALARLVARASGPDRDPAVDVAIAEAYAFRGEEDEALKWVTRAMHRQLGRNWTREDVMQSPFLRALHADARWQTLLARAATRP
jgi:TolB-like protein/DNA-binding winged helix-turn-helix (wHTH) protein